MEDGSRKEGRADRRGLLPTRQPLYSSVSAGIDPRFLPLLCAFMCVSYLPSFFPPHNTHPLLPVLWYFPSYTQSSNVFLLLIPIRYPHYYCIDVSVKTPREYSGCMMNRSEVTECSSYKNFKIISTLFFFFFLFIYLFIYILYTWNFQELNEKLDPSFFFVFLYIFIECIETKAHAR